MPCFNPMIAFPSKDGGRPRFSTSFSRSYVEFNRSLPKDLDTLPCRQCIGCRLDYSRQWAIRCTHEASLYEDNSFVTLTYSPAGLPYRGQLVQRDMQLFLKRLRFYFSSIKIRYYYVGEYGEKFKRPHYHAIFFNLDFPDKVFWKQVKDHKYFRSPKLDKIWGKGMCVIGNVTFESAAYTARYVTKKVNGKAAADHYLSVDRDTGEIYQLVPEFSRCSTSRGIGYEYFKAWKSDLYPSDQCVVRGHVCKPPKYYDRLLEQEDPTLFERVKAQRLLDRESKDDLLFRHLKAMEKHTRQRMSRLVRVMEAEA